MIFSFSHPQYLFLLFIIPIFFLIHFLSLSNKKKIALKFANFDAIARIQGVEFFSKNIVIFFFSLLVVFLMILAVSGLTFHTFSETTSFSFVITMDSSQSMEANDLLPNRLAASKQTAKDFVDAIPYSTNLGVVSFSGSSFIESDMSEDKIQVRGAIENIELSEWGGTDIYEAIITSTNLLKSEESRAIILLSDGQLNVASLEEIVYYANKNDIIVHTIAIGTKEGGETTYAISKLDEDFLRSLAYNTGGVYFDAEDKETLSQSFLDILNLTEGKVSIDLSSYLIILSIIFFVIEFFLANTKYLNII